MIKKNKQRNLIIIGGGLLQVPLIEAAHAIENLNTIVFDMSSDALGMQIAGRQVIMSTRDIEGCVREARKITQTETVHGVITAGTDASRAVAAIASALDLPGIRYSDAEACSNKVLMRQRLHSHNIPIPVFHSVCTMKEARDAMNDLTLPLVLKPAENMGARGVIKITQRQEIYTAFPHTKKYSPTGEMIIEEYMAGDELSVDALAWQSKYKITGIADRIIAREPFFIELGHNMPSIKPDRILEEAKDVMYRAMVALGIHTGAAKGDLKITSQGIKVGEIAARLSGGFMSSHTYPLHSGVNLLQAAIRIALGENPKENGELTPQKTNIAIERSILSNPGKILKIDGIHRMRSVPNIRYVYFIRKIGELIPPITSNIDKVGHIIAEASDLASAEAAVEKARTYLDIELDESYGIDWKEIKEKARQRFGDKVCWVCKACDGKNCASGVPGMGGVGTMQSFQDNSTALSEIYILPRYIRDPVEVDTSIELFGRKLEFPIMAAPMTGTVTNMDGAISNEYEFAHILLQSCRANGTIAWVGDGASPEKYLTIMEAIRESEGFGIAIFKPRADREGLRKRFQLAADLGLVAIGMDVDAISFPTMQRRKVATRARNTSELKYIRDMSPLPFILKGIMSTKDAESALELGVDAIVVSNHGGRVLDQMPGTARILGDIVKVVRGRVPVFVDGGVRSGQDAFKMLALGANAVLVGRPVAIAAVGGGMPAVKNLFASYASELEKTMHLCGTASLEDISGSYIFSAPGALRKNQESH